MRGRPKKTWTMGAKSIFNAFYMYCNISLFHHGSSFKDIVWTYMNIDRFILNIKFKLCTKNVFIYLCENDVYCRIIFS